MRTISQSELRVYRRCPREHRIAYLERVRPRVLGDALRYGILVHAALEAWWRAAMAGTERLAPALAALDEAGDADHYDRARARMMMLGYDARWADQDLEVLGVEVEFVAPIRNPETGASSRTYQLAGKIDAIARDPSGRVLIVEHKTTSVDASPGSPYWQRLALDSQISAYFVGARALGYEPAACLYDVLVKPSSRPAKATPEESRKYTKTGALYAGQRLEDESPEEYQARIGEAIAGDPSRYYVRGEVVRLEADEREAAHDAWLVAGAMRDAERSGVAPRNVDACDRYGSQCPYFGVCTGAASIDDPVLFRRAERAHEELAQ